MDSIILHTLVVYTLCTLSYNESSSEVEKHLISGHRMFPHRAMYSAAAKTYTCIVRNRENIGGTQNVEQKRLQ